jgi:hypothetical protein
MTQLTPVSEPQLGGTTLLTGPAAVLDDSDWEGMLYRTEPAASRPCTIKAIPYYAWDNREPSAMQVWIQAARG